MQETEDKRAEGPGEAPNPFEGQKTRLDEVQDGIYRISTFAKEFGISFNQFLVKDEKSALIHTGPGLTYGEVEKKINEVFDIAKLDYVVLLHFEADEWGGMPFLDSAKAKLVCSRVSSEINLGWWHDLPKRHIGVWEDETISLGRKKLRFLMTPHVHHWDSMMVFEETEKALFPSDLFLQRGDNKPVMNEPKLVDSMIEQYKHVGIFAHEKPVRDTLPKLERLDARMIHAMHGSSLDSSVHRDFFNALRTRDFAYRNELLFGELPS